MAIVMLDILICKARVPVGRIILELPAGMLDDDKGDFVGTAVREVYFSLPLILSLFLYIPLTHSSCTGSACFMAFSTCMSHIFICLC